MQHKVEICGVNTAKLKVLKSSETQELLRKTKAGDAAAREDADETVKNQLNDNIQTMADYTVTEAQIENLVVAKGYADCVAFIGEDTLSLAVAAPEGGLTEADTAKIVDVVNRTAGFNADQISIIEVE